MLPGMVRGEKPKVVHQNDLSMSAAKVELGVAAGAQLDPVSNATLASSVFDGDSRGADVVSVVVPPDTYQFATSPSGLRYSGPPVSDGIISLELFEEGSLQYLEPRHVDGVSS